jgi:hypothetical protein
MTVKGPLSSSTRVAIAEVSRSTSRACHQVQDLARRRGVGVCSLDAQEARLPPLISHVPAGL